MGMSAFILRDFLLIAWDQKTSGNSLYSRILE